MFRWAYSVPIKRRSHRTDVTKLGFHRAFQHRTNHQTRETLNPSRCSAVVFGSVELIYHRRFSFFLFFHSAIGNGCVHVMLIPDHIAGMPPFLRAARNTWTFRHVLQPWARNPPEVTFRIQYTEFESSTRGAGGGGCQVCSIPRIRTRLPRSTFSFPKKKQIKDVSFSAPCSPKSYSREKTRKKHTLSGRRDLFPGRRSIIFAAPKSSPPPPRVPCPLPARSIAQRYLRDEAATACSSGVPIVSYTFSFVSVEVQTRGASPFPKCSSRFPAHPSLPALRAFTNLHFSRPHRMRNFPLSSRVLPQSSFPFFLLLP